MVIQGLYDVDAEARRTEARGRESARGRERRGMTEVIFEAGATAGRATAEGGETEWTAAGRATGTRARARHSQQYLAIGEYGVALEQPRFQVPQRAAGGNSCGCGTGRAAIGPESSSNSFFFAASSLRV